VIQPTGAKVNIPCADFFYMKNGKIKRFDCYPALNIMSSKWACLPTSLPPSSVRLALTPFSVHGTRSLNLPCGGDWADLRRAVMKAVRLLEYAGQLVFNDIPTPTIARDEILVKIRSTAVNHLDLVEASGMARQILPIDLPWIPGHEFSGSVEQIGSDVATFAPGDAVFGTTSGMGAYAEYLAVKASAIARKPANLSFEEAASVPVASQTAWQGLFSHGHLERDKRS
jgi:hypothetical protein